MKSFIIVLIVEEFLIISICNSQDSDADKTIIVHHYDKGGKQFVLTSFIEDGSLEDVLDHFAFWSPSDVNDVDQKEGVTLTGRVDTHTTIKVGIKKYRYPYYETLREFDNYTKIFRIYYRGR